MLGNLESSIMKANSRWLFCALLVMGFVAPRLARADEAPQPRDANAIFADFVRASGGEGPWTKRRSLSMKMKLEIRGLALSGTASALWTASGRYLETGEIPNMLTTQRGGDGKRFWSQDPIDGLRWLQGAEAEQTAVTGSWKSYLRLRALSASAKLVAPLEPGTECVEFGFKASPPLTACFDLQSHLLTLETGKKVSPQGETPYTTRLSDYRNAGGVMFPYSQETTAGPATFVVTVQDIQWDVPAPAKLFALPKPPKPN